MEPGLGVHIEFEIIAICLIISAPLTGLLEVISNINSLKSPFGAFIADSDIVKKGWR